MKKLLLLSVLFVSGCATAGTPLDLIWPTIVPPMVENYLEHDVPSLGRVTTLAILRGAQQEIELKHMLNELEYTGASQSVKYVVQATESMQGDVLAGLAAIGLGSAGIGIPVARRMKRKGDYTKEEWEKAGQTDPEQFKKTT